MIHQINTYKYIHTPSLIHWMCNISADQFIFCFIIYHLRRHVTYVFCFSIPLCLLFWWHIIVCRQNICPKIRIWMKLCNNFEKNIVLMSKQRGKRFCFNWNLIIEELIDIAQKEKKSINFIWGWGPFIRNRCSSCAGR